MLQLTIGIVLLIIGSYLEFKRAITPDPYYAEFKRQPVCNPPNGGKCITR